MRVDTCKSSCECLLFVVGLDAIFAALPRTDLTRDRQFLLKVTNPFIGKSRIPLIVFAKSCYRVSMSGFLEFSGVDSISTWKEKSQNKKKQKRQEDKIMSYEKKEENQDQEFWKIWNKHSAKGQALILELLWRLYGEPATLTTTLEEEASLTWGHLNPIQKRATLTLLRPKLLARIPLPRKTNREVSIFYSLGHVYLGLDYLFDLFIGHVGEQDNVHRGLFSCYTVIIHCNNPSNLSTLCQTWEPLTGAAEVRVTE